jgi:hypothetical protein
MDADAGPCVLIKGVVMSSKAVSAASAAFRKWLGRWLGRVVEPSPGPGTELARMSDRELSDLGIGRSEIGQWIGRHAADGRERPDRAGSDASGRR